VVPISVVNIERLEKHIGIIPVKFVQNPMSGFREEDV